MIYVLDESLKIIDILRKYNFAQYINKFRGIGTFQINAQLVNENIYLLDETKQYYILFDNDEYVFGQITKIKQSGEGDNDKEIIIEGQLSKYIFTKRVINGIIKYTGKTYKLIDEIVRTNVVESDNENRNLNININYDSNVLESICSKLTDKQITGGYVWEEVEKLLSQDNLGILFTPNVTQEQNEQNIQSWDFVISGGVDRTKKNVNNEPVIFSQQLSNISSVNYERNVEDYTNCAYVAGEGEEEQRKWYEVERDSNNKKVGWNRKELWVDARDLQSEKEDGTVLTEEQYESIINERAKQKFTENDVKETYEATVVQENKKYVYGEHYNLGDWCTVIDLDLNKEIDVQITEITVTIQGTRKIVDAGFTYGLVRKELKDVLKQNEQNIIKNEVNIKVIDEKANKANIEIEKIKKDLSEDTGWLYPTLDSNFIIYGENVNPKYRKIGNMVEIRGAVKPTKILTGSTTDYVIFNLPEKYIPNQSVVFLGHCGSVGICTFEVLKTGEFVFSRYRKIGESDYSDTTTETWIPFQVFYFVD